MITSLLAETTSGGLQYFSQGGIFIYIILGCSVLSVAVMIWKALALQQNRIIPTKIENAVLAGTQSIEELRPMYDADQSSLSRLCRLIAQSPSEDLVEAAARKELNRLRAGLNIIEIIITIAPLLGLLGTVSGLVTVFGDFGGNADNGAIAKGIAQALSTTIAGLAVAVPSVIAYSYFNRRLDTYAARLELILSQLCSSLK